MANSTVHDRALAGIAVSPSTLPAVLRSLLGQDGSQPSLVVSSQRSLGDDTEE